MDVKGLSFRLDFSSKRGNGEGTGPCAGCSPSTSRWSDTHAVTYFADDSQRCSRPTFTSRVCTVSEATEALRGLVDAIVMTPAGDGLRIALKGNLAAMLGATVQSKRTTGTEVLLLQVSMVAGARNQHYLQLWRPAA